MSHGSARQCDARSGYLMKLWRCRLWRICHARHGTTAWSGLENPLGGVQVGRSLVFEGGPRHQEAEFRRNLGHEGEGLVYARADEEVAEPLRHQIDAPYQLRGEQEARPVPRPL